MLKQSKLDQIFTKTFANPGLFNFHQWQTHLRTFVEIALTYSSHDQKCILALWSSCTKYRDIYAWHKSAQYLASRKYIPEEIVKSYFHKISPMKKIEIVKFEQNQKSYKLTSKTSISIEQLKKIDFEGFEIGWAILSSIGMNLCSIDENYEINSSKINQIFNSYIEVYNNAINVAKNHELETFIVFNGRYIHDHAVVCAAKKLGKKILYYESGGLLKDFVIQDFPIHDRKIMQNKMRDELKVKNLKLIEENSKLWFDNQSKQYKYSRNKKINKLINNTKKDIVCYFSSSEDEMFALDSTWQSNLGSQLDVLTFLNKYAKNHNVLVIVKDHPNFKRRKRKMKIEWRKKISKLTSLVYIDYRQDYNSYDLIECANTVITHGSTIGIEAVNRFKKVITTFPSFYDELDIVFKPKSFNELELIIENDNLRINGVNHILFGHFFASRGFNLNYLTKSENIDIYKKLLNNNTIKKIYFIFFNKLPDLLRKF